MNGKLKTKQISPLTEIMHMMNRNMPLTTEWPKNKPL